MQFTGFTLAKTIQEQGRQKFSLYQIDDLQIDPEASEPTITMKGQQKLTHHSIKLKLVAEQQETNSNNVHLTLLADDDSLIQLYRHNRGQYVTANHAVAKEIEQSQLIPENLYPIQDAVGRPGIDFLKADEFTDALNTLMMIKNLFTRELKRT